MNTYKCLCKRGYTGRFCDKESDECLSDPCQNNAPCLDYFNLYICACLPGDDLHASRVYK